MPINMHINGTNKPIQFKVWTTDPDNVKSNHFVVLKSHNIDARCYPNFEVITAASGDQYRYLSSKRAEFVTTCKEQESVLHLLYGKGLILRSTEVVLPNMMMTYE